MIWINIPVHFDLNGTEQGTQIVTQINNIASKQANNPIIITLIDRQTEMKLFSRIQSVCVCMRRFRNSIWKLFAIIRDKFTKIIWHFDAWIFIPNVRLLGWFIAENAFNVIQSIQLSKRLQNNRREKRKINRTAKKLRQQMFQNERTKKVWWKMSERNDVDKQMRKFH